MNAATPHRAKGVLRLVCAIVPTILAASVVPNLADAAHDGGVAHVLALQAQPWRALDIAVGALLAPLPVGTFATRAALGGALVVGVAGMLLFDTSCFLLDACWDASLLGYVVAAVGTWAALVAAPWHLEAVSVASSATGAVLVLLALLLTLRAIETTAPAAWKHTALALGLTMGQEPGVFACALAGGIACAVTSARGRASLSRAWRESKASCTGWLAAGLAPLFLALVRVRLSGVKLSWAAYAPSASGSLWTSPLVLAREEIGPVLLLLAVVGGGIAAFSTRARPASAGLAAVAVTGMLWGAPVGPSLFGAPILAAAAAVAALAAVSMLGLVRAVARANIPLAGTAAGLFVVLELVIPVEAADEALVRSASRASAIASRWDDTAWGTLEPRAVVLVDDERVRERAAAAAAQALLRDDIVIMSANGRSAPRGGPFATDLVPLLRDLALSGAPTEASLSALASVRPFVASYDAAWGPTIGRHLLPMEIFDRVQPEPLASSDRRRALEGFIGARQELHREIAGDRDLCAATASLLRARATLFATLGERQLLERAASDVRPFETQ
jgi:hypothetical protein